MRRAASIEPGAGVPGGPDGPQPLAAGEPVGVRTSRDRGGPAAARHRPAASGEVRSLDFNLHDLVGIRLVDAAPEDVAAVRAQLGPIERPLSREPDLTIRFQDRLAISSPVRLIGIGEAAHTEDAFLVLRSKHKIPARVAIPFDTVGGRCEIRCERGLPAVPLLIAMVNLTALARGALAMHASAFRYRGRGVLVTGWSQGGKTETLFGFMADGAEYIGDEWIYLHGEDPRMYGVPEPVRLWDWHLAQLPGYGRRLGHGPRMRLLALRLLSRSLALAGGAGRVGPTRWRRRLHGLAALLDRQRYIRIPPRAAFGSAYGALEGPLDKVIFVASHDAPGTTVEPADPGEVADRMVFSLQEERHELLSYYRRFRFAFPEKANPWIESAEAIERERLRRLLQDKDCYVVHHPYPPSIRALVDVVRPLIAS